MEAKFKTYLEAAEITKLGETKLTDKELMFEAISAMRKLKKFKDVKEARAALDVDFTKLRKDLQDIEDTIAEMIHDVAFLLMDEEAGEDMDSDEEAFDRAHKVFEPLIKGVSSIDFKRVKERILSEVKRKIDMKHESEAESASAKTKAEAPVNAE